MDEGGISPFGAITVASNPLASVLLFNSVGQEQDLRLLIYH